MVTVMVLVLAVVSVDCSGDGGDHGLLWGRGMLVLMGCGGGCREWWWWWRWYVVVVEDGGVGDCGRMGVVGEGDEDGEGEWSRLWWW